MPSVSSASAHSASHLTARAQEAKEARRQPDHGRETERAERTEKPKAATEGHVGRKVDVKA